MACWAIGRLLGPSSWWPGVATNQPVVRHVQRRPGRQAPPGSDLPVDRGRDDLRDPAPRRAVAARRAPAGRDCRWRRTGATPAPPPAGIVIGVGMVLWGIERFFDEHLWLGEDGHLGSLLVQGAGIALAVAGTILLITRIGPLDVGATARAAIRTRYPCPSPGPSGAETGVGPLDPSGQPSGPEPEPEPAGHPPVGDVARVSSTTGGPVPLMATVQAARSRDGRSRDRDDGDSGTSMPPDQRSATALQGTTRSSAVARRKPPRTSALAMTMPATVATQTEPAARARAEADRR